ncbi:MAG: hypothetical protein KF902_05345 [Phycisphaeraceae bacterium]|nr:hypothetical protein [Phycisphaeraceae bacterium]MCW5768256.1 hypothetical protein [Phycisphaeraceae bacterium]
MNGSCSIEIDPAQVGECCRAIAGVLAEHAIPLLTLESKGSPPRTLHSRETNLPGELQRLIPCTLRVQPPTQLELHLSAGSIRWSTTDSSLSESLTRALC